MWSILAVNIEHWSQRHLYKSMANDLGQMTMTLSALHINKCGVKGVHDKMKGHNGR